MAESQRLAALRGRVQEQPCDQDAWDDLIEELRAQRDVTAVREAYEALLAEFPTAAQYWKDYAEFEVGHGGDNAAKAIFSRCLLRCPVADLWRAYLKLVRRVDERKGAVGLPELRQAYEFTLDRLGQDALAGPVWEEYIDMLEAAKPGTPEHEALFGAGAQEGSARTVALRRAFQKALLVPGPSLDALWAGYERFELRGDSRSPLAKRAIDEWRPLWQAARALAGRRTDLVRRLAWHALPTPPGGSPRPRVAAAAVAAAREWLAWEVANPQALDEAAYASRVSLCFEQALALHPGRADLALAFADWHERGGGEGAAAALAVLQEARAQAPACLALHLAAAEALERAGEVADARAVFEEVVAGLGPKAGDEQAAEGEGASADAPLSSSAPPALLSDSEQGTLAWVHYMRFAARTEGLMAARKVFLRARKWPGVGWRAFAASADLEWAGAAGGPDTVTRNVFELGLLTHLREPGYVLHYLRFLRGRGDLTNARALLERALKEAEEAPGALHALLDAYLELESETGSQAAARAVEARRREALLRALGDHAEPEAAAGRALALGLGAAALKYGALGALPTTPADAAEWRLAVAGYDGKAVDGSEQGAPGRDVPDAPPRSRALSPPAEAADEVAPRAATRRSARDSEEETQSASVARPRGASSRWSPEPEAGSRGRRGRSASPDGPPTLPRELQLFIADLPPAHEFKGPLPDVEQVLSVAVANDYTPAGVEAHEAAAARERRRQRAAQGQAPPGVPPHAPAAYDPAAAAGYGASLKRKPEYGSDSGDEDYRRAGGAYGAPGGADLYRMRRARVARP